MCTHTGTWRHAHTHTVLAVVKLAARSPFKGIVDQKFEIPPIHYPPLGSVDIFRPTQPSPQSDKRAEAAKKKKILCVYCSRGDGQASWKTQQSSCSETATSTASVQPNDPLWPPGRQPLSHNYCSGFVASKLTCFISSNYGYFVWTHSAQYWNCRNHTSTSIDV